MNAKDIFKRFIPGSKQADSTAGSILIVDDDQGLSDNLKDILETEGYLVYCAASFSEASQIAREQQPQLALVDIKLPDRSGTVLLSDLKRIAPDCVCMLMTAYADVDTAVLALERGAFYYLQKPIKPPELVELVELAFETIRVREEKRRAEEQLRARNEELEEIISRLQSKIEGK